jgi:tRNA (mo5U34)-methyltransferase
MWRIWKVLQEEIESLGPWFHNLHLPDGTQTNPDHHFGDFPSFKWKQISAHIPRNLDGWTALDIGCNAGFYSFELAKRGAKVTGIDINTHYLSQSQWAMKQFGLESRVHFEQCQIYDFALRPEKYDIIMFMGVFYHLRYPLLGLDIVAEKVRQLMVFQTLCLTDKTTLSEAQGDTNFQSRHLLEHPGWPKMAFIENSFCLDPTNWWVPNHAAVLAMLRSTGFRVIGQPGEEIYVCEPDKTHAAVNWNRDEFLAAASRVTCSAEGP